MESALRNNDDYTLLDTVKGGVRFTNDKLDDLNKVYAEIKNDYEDKQKNIVTEILEIAGNIFNRR